jgi:DNA-binding response OmpR family regulator
MLTPPNLAGRRILVVEDEYFVATDIAQALQEAGAEVIGPCRTEAAARAELKGVSPDAVLLDVRLGPQPSFALAEQVAGRELPFLFITGLAPDLIPAGFRDVPRLAKPVSPRRVVEAVAQLLLKSAA